MTLAGTIEPVVVEEPASKEKSISSSVSAGLLALKDKVVQERDDLELAGRFGDLSVIAPATYSHSTRSEAVQRRNAEKASNILYNLQSFVHIGATQSGLSRTVLHTEESLKDIYPLVEARRQFSNLRRFASMLEHEVSATMALFEEKLGNGEPLTRNEFRRVREIESELPSVNTAQQIVASLERVHESVDAIVTEHLAASKASVSDGFVQMVFQVDPTLKEVPVLAESLAAAFAEFTEVWTQSYPNNFDAISLAEANLDAAIEDAVAKKRAL